MSLEDVISKSLEDARGTEVAEDPSSVDEATESLDTADTTSDEVEESPSEPVEASTDDEGKVEGVEATSSEVASPGAKQAVPDPTKQAEQDEFSKKHGIKLGKDNRLPYSRLKPIIENAEKRAIEPLQAQLAELQPKVQEYEERLGRVQQFEQIMLGSPQEFLTMLSQIPAYAQIFSQLQRKQAEPPADPDSDMPMPDKDAGDGTMIYSMEGLKALNAWNRAQARKETLAEVAPQFEQLRQQVNPFVEERQMRQQYEALIPGVQAQIDEARKWPQFNENEDGIVKALEANPKLSLEGAYRQVVFPKFQSNEQELRNSIRKEVLAEIKKAPSTSAPTRATKPGAAPVGGGSGDAITDAIVNSMREAGLK